MESELPTPKVEQFSSTADHIKPGDPSPDISKLESRPIHSIEKLDNRSDDALSLAQSSIPGLALPTPIPPNPVSDDTNVSAANSSNPLFANDDDLIEKEWVDKAKLIISNTKDDPHLREKQIRQLQADYLLKRYGKELGVSL